LARAFDDDVNTKWWVDMFAWSPALHELSGRGGLARVKVNEESGDPTMRMQGEFRLRSEKLLLRALNESTLANHFYQFSLRFLLDIFDHTLFHNRTSRVFLTMHSDAVFS